MASILYWYGGTGNSNSATGHWSTNSGNSPSADHVAPVAGDAVIFDGNSSAGGASYTCTVNSNLYCASITMANPSAGTLTLAGTSSILASGNIEFGLSMNLTWSGSLNMVATSGTQTLKMNGITLVGGLYLNGTGGTFQLVDNLTLGSNITFTAGTFDATTNNTTVTLTGSTGTVLGALTFYNLTKAPASPAKTASMVLTGNIIVSGTFTTSNGATATNRILISSNIVGTPRTITAAAVSIANTDFMDITGAGAATWDLSAVTGGSGNCGGNTMKALGDTAFTVADTWYWFKDTGSWSSQILWFDQTGGAGIRLDSDTRGAKCILPQDTAVFDASSFSAVSRWVTQDMPRIGSVIWTGATNTPVWNLATSANVYGSMTMISGMIFNDTTTLYTFSGRGSYTLDVGGQIFDMTLVLDAPTGTLQLGSNLTIGSTRRLSVVNGTFTCVNGANNYAFSAYAFSMLNGGTMTLGSATHTIRGYGTTAWNVTGGTLTASTGTIKMTATTGAYTFVGGGKTYGNVWFAHGTSAYAITISENNTFADIKDDGTVAHSILFNAGETQHVTTWSVSGTAGQLITINSTSTSTHHLVKDGGGTISADYLDIQHSVATPSATWYAGANSVDHQATATAGSGWIFTAPPGAATGIIFLV